LGTVQAADEARPRGRPIEFSDLNGGSSSTNSITLGSPSTGRLNLPDMVTKPGSIDLRVTPTDRLPSPSSGVVVSRKRKERKDEWTTPEDAFDRYLMEEVLGLPDFLTGDDDPRLGAPRRNRGILSRNRGQTNAPATLGPVSDSPEEAADEMPDTRSVQPSHRAILLEGTISPSKAQFSSDSASVGPPSRWLNSSSGTFTGGRSFESMPDGMRNSTPRETQAPVFQKSLSPQPAVSAERVNPPFTIGASPFSTPMNGTVNPPQQSLFNPLPGAFTPSFVPTAPSIPTAPTVPLAPGLPGLSTPEPPAPNKWMRPDPAPAFPRRQM
jgi:hypothetical protein